MIQQGSLQALNGQEQHYISMMDEFDVERALKNMNKASKVISAVQKLFPNYFMVYYKLALYYKQMGDSLNALRNLRIASHLCITAAERDSQENKYWESILYAFECSSSGQMDVAEIYYKKAIDILPNRMEAYFRYGLALGSQKKYQEAIPMFEKAKTCVEEECESTEPTPCSCESSSAAYKLALCAENIGWSLAHQEKDEEAIVYYDEAVRIYPNFVLFYENRFYANKTRSKFQDAIDDCQAAIDLTEDVKLKARLMCMAATVYAQVQRHELACKTCLTALELDPTLHNAYFELVALPPYLNNFEMSLELMNVGLSKIEDFNSRYWLLYRRAHIFENLGRLTEAEADKKAMKKILRLANDRID
ncbi:hypothetical protein AKO1_007365 [Acrasis kona]|uniref:Tetratricopeptide repeat protein n=1 Tax=Acrasis kona TaxID=1008807 RepID=A0AAW2YSX9_9EUKA